MSLIVAWLAASVVVLWPWCAAAAPEAQPSIALYYGSHVPVAQLSSFDAVDVEPGSGFELRALKARHPATRLIFNRGFELMPEVHGLAYVVAFESLYRGWTQAHRQYVEVSQADRDWLLAKAKSLVCAG